MKVNKQQQEVIDSNESHILCLAGAGAGKALAHGTKVMTLNGYRNIEDIQINDDIIASDGHAYRVTGVYPQGEIPAYSVNFSDGSSIVCSSDHLWIYKSYSDLHDNESDWRVCSTSELLSQPFKVFDGSSCNNLYVPSAPRVVDNNQNYQSLDSSDAYQAGKKVARIFSTSTNFIEDEANCKTEINMISQCFSYNLAARCAMFDGIAAVSSWHYGDRLLNCASLEVAKKIQQLGETLGIQTTISELRLNSKSKLATYQLTISWARCRSIESIVPLNYTLPMTCIAVDSPDHSYLTEHAIVTHNTTVMLERAKRLISEGVDADSILCLTFTNAAANEMLDRFKKFGLSKNPEFKTFHAFCYSLIIKDKDVRKAIGYIDVPTICADAELKKLQKTVKLTYKITLSDDVLSGDGSGLSRKSLDEYNLYHKVLGQELRKANKITFDIMCYDVADLFAKNSDIVAKYKDRYKHIFVDEFQDTDMKQLKFVGSFTNSNFLLVGDALQNLYSFRGTTNEPIKQFSSSPVWHTIKLYDNYRSSNQIVGVANRFTKRYASDNYRIEMKAQFDGPQVIKIYGSTTSYSQPVDDDHIRDLLSRLPHCEGSSAVLCRSNAEVNYLKSVVKEAGIVFNSSNPNDESLSVLAASEDNEFMLTWLASKLTSEKYAEYIRLSAIVDNPDIFWFANVYKNEPGINNLGKKVVEIRRILKANTDKLAAVNSILEILEHDKIDDVSEYESLSIIETASAVVNKQTPTSCYIGTIHSVKGLEYDNVFVMGVNDKRFQLDSEDMKNLYYVAITRAKKNLVIYNA